MFYIQFPSGPKLGPFDNVWENPPFIYAHFLQDGDAREAADKWEVLAQNLLVFRRIPQSTFVQINSKDGTMRFYNGFEYVDL